MNKHKFILLSSVLVFAACDLEYEKILDFPGNPDNPEGIDFDDEGNIIVSMALTGHVRRINPDTLDQDSLAWIPLGQCAPNPFPPILGAVAVEGDYAYVNANTCDDENRGVWRIELATKDAELFIPLPAFVLANGISVNADENAMYIADSASATLWTAPLDGSGPATAFITDPLLAPTGAVFDPTPGQPGDEVPLPGSNGVQRYKDGLLVANSSSGDLVYIEAGVASVHANVPGGCDDFSVDVKGNVICTTDPNQTVVLVKPSGENVEIFAAPEDALDGPTAVACQDYTCYVTNAAFPFFPSTGVGASIGRFHYPIPEAPR